MSSLHDDLLADLRTVRPAPAAPRPAAAAPAAAPEARGDTPVLQAFVTRERWSRPSFRLQRGERLEVTVGAGPVRVELSIP